MANTRIDLLLTLDSDTISIELDKDGDIIMDINNNYPTLLFLDDLDRLIKVLRSAKLKAVEYKKELKGK